jgi:glyoxylase-like metal-dependent hydrolase (beta-lactamase superfamily II)
MSGPLHLDVFVVPYKPIVGLIPSMGEGEASWPATAVSLISGERDAVLVDAVLTSEDAGRVVDWIRATGRNLTTIYITHGHGDHFFGLNRILDAFPNASAVTAAAVVPQAQGQSARS